VSEPRSEQVIEVGGRSKKDFDIIILEDPPDSGSSKITPNSNTTNEEFKPNPVKLSEKVACLFFVQGKPQPITHANIIQLIRETEHHGYQQNIAPFFNPLGFLTMILNTCIAGHQNLLETHKL
jgi:hypothetical protein